MSVSNDSFAIKSPYLIRPPVSAESSPRFLTDVKVKQAWLGALALLTFVGAAVFTALSFTASPWFLAAAIPLFLATGAIVWSAARMIDYEDPKQLGAARERAAKMPLMQTAEKHGWDKIFRYEILSPAQFDAAYRALVGGQTLNALIQTYRFVNEQVAQAGAQETHFLPAPAEWKEKLIEETGGLNFIRLVHDYSLSDLIQYDILSPKQFTQSFNEFANASPVLEILRCYAKTKQQIAAASQSFNPQFIQQFALSMPKLLREKFVHEWGDKKASEIARGFAAHLPALLEHRIIQEREYEILARARAEFDAADWQIVQARCNYTNHLELYEKIREQEKEIAQRMCTDNPAHAQIRALKESERADRIEIDRWFDAGKRFQPERAADLGREKKRKLDELSAKHRLLRAPYDAVLSNAWQLRNQSYDLADREFEARKTDLKKELDRTIQGIEFARDQRLSIIDAELISL